MSRIAVVTSSPPFTEGGHLVIARALVRALREHGHQADLVVTPSNRFGRQAAAYLANWLTDVGRTGAGERIDQVITTRYPSYAVRHERHVCWLNHPMREYYDLWDAWSQQLSPQGRVKEAVRRSLIHAADTYCFKHHVTRLVAQSATVQARLMRWNRVSSTVVYPPAPHRDYRCDGYGDFVLAYSRLAPLKRLSLIIESLAVPEARGVRLVIAGDGQERAQLEALARARGVETRVTFAGAVSDAELTDLLATCRAVCFVPKDEDYGMVTAEAFASAKGVITATDSGAPVELVSDGARGDVVAPTPEALAAALARVSEDRTLAEQWGQRALERAKEMTWTRALERLIL